MTNFDTRFAARSFPRMLARFGESIVYRPHNKPPRTITAIVDRNPPESAPESSGFATDRYVISVKDDEIDGIGSKQLDTGVDAVEISKRRGVAATRMRIHKLLNADGGFLELEVR